MYIIEYQKRGLLYIYLLVFLNSANEFLEAFYIDKVICVKLSIIKDDLTAGFIKTVTLVMFYSPYGKINPNLFYMSNT